MADETNPFASMGSAVRRFWGPSEDERILDRKLGAVKEKGAADQARLQELGQVWAQMVEDFGGDENLALKKFITSPEFFRLGGNDAMSMVKTFKEITAAPKPTVVPEGAAVLDEGASVPRYKNPKTFAPEKTAETEETKALTKRGIDILGKIADDGPAAQEDLQSIAQLRASIQGKGGFLIGLRGLAAQWGIPTGSGTSDLQVAQSLIDRLAPKQRVPGSGSSSDKDVAIFKSSLPSLFKYDAGNQLILDGLEALAQGRLKNAEIANKPFTSSASWKDTMKELQEAESPLHMFKRMRAERGDFSGVKDAELSTMFDDPATGPAARRNILNEMKRRRGR